MIDVKHSEVINKLLAHVGEQRVRAKLVDSPFDLGIVTDKRPSHILKLINKNIDILTEIGMANQVWHDDALRSTLRLGGEELLISICRPR